MTARPQLDDRDPLPPEPWRETSHAGIRRLAIDACKTAVNKARDARTAENRDANEEQA